MWWWTSRFFRDIFCVVWNFVVHVNAAMGRKICVQSCVQCKGVVVVLFYANFVIQLSNCTG